MKESKVWFPAKKNGWGWQAPTCWQGRAVLVVYFVFFILLTSLIHPKENLEAWVICTVVLTSIVLGVIRLKGDAPNWKWKKIEKEKRSLFRFEKSIDLGDSVESKPTEKKD
ncbi:hypothetical protein [Marinomonas balearica]|uniref:Uncharacterized protein n=1 Tax=Marinomonas balearica TaxID=491947 RepID=A0A4R6MD39_9GAMM|nr:hypothetical protein [Marinomonas balearica]TDO99463.1 hypothetical protein DFP79_0445 [Marinomonas balearica]